MIEITFVRKNPVRYLTASPNSTAFRQREKERLVCEKIFVSTSINRTKPLAFNWYLLESATYADDPDIYAVAFYMCYAYTRLR